MSSARIARGRRALMPPVALEQPGGRRPTVIAFGSTAVMARVATLRQLAGVAEPGPHGPRVTEELVHARVARQAWRDFQRFASAVESASGELEGHRLFRKYLYLTDGDDTAPGGGCPIKAPGAPWAAGTWMRFLGKAIHLPIGASVTRCPHTSIQAFRSRAKGQEARSQFGSRSCCGKASVPAITSRVRRPRALRHAGVQHRCGRHFHKSADSPFSDATHLRHGLALW